MKKVILLLAGTFGISGANAQYAKNSFSVLANNTKRIPFVNTLASNQSCSRHSGAKTTAVAFASENFGTGTSVSLPAGWTAGSFSGSGTWHWAKVASTSAYSLGVINSATTGNGWMIFDSDSLGTACSCAPAGWLQSPAYNDSGHATVRLNFEEFYEKFNDSCFVWVSTDSTFATYTSYPVLPNNNLLANVTTANPITVHINISSVAAGQPKIYIRFVYYDNAGQTGGYSWMIDDISLTELDAHDIGVSGSFMYEPETTAYNGSIFNTPLAFIDSIYPLTYLSNFGAHAEDSVVTTASIYKDTVVYTQNVIYNGLPVNAYDSLIRFPGFLPAAIGTYTCLFETTIDSIELNPANNTDTALFNVTDSIWQENSGAVNKSYYCHRATMGIPASFMQGTRFDVPSSSAGDTVSGFGVAFSAASVPTNSGGKVSVQLYSTKQSDSAWTYVGTSVARAIMPADIPSITGLVWSDFRIDTASSGGFTPFILHAGTTYAAVVQVNGVTTDLLVNATVAGSGTGLHPGIGFFGQVDTSNDDGATSFSTSSARTGNPDAVPLVRMYFGDFTDGKTLVKNITATGNYVGAPYPNPANTSINIPFNMAADVEVTVTIYNVLGQVINTQSLWATGGQSMKAAFAVKSLPDGVYLYTVDAGGQHSNGRVVIAH